MEGGWHSRAASARARTQHGAGGGTTGTLHRAEPHERWSRAAGREPRIRVNPGLPAGVPRLVADPQRLNGFCPPQVRLEEYIAGLSWL